MVLHNKARIFCSLLLALFDSFVDKFEHFAALHTNHVIMVTGIVELENRAAPFKIMSDDKTG